MLFVALHFCWENYIYLKNTIQGNNAYYIIKIIYESIKIRKHNEIIGA